MDSSRLKDSPVCLRSFAGCPIKVQIHLQFVERLRRRMATCKPGSYEDGVLIGEGQGGRCEVWDFVPVERAPGDGIQKPVAAIVKEHGARSVGYYRVQRGGALRPNADDLAVADALLGGGHQIVLLIQGAGSLPSATVFFRENGAINADCSLLQFPFDPALLAAAEGQNGAAAIRQKQDPIPAGSAAPIPAPRAVPPVSRRRHLWAGAIWTAVVAVATLAALIGFGALMETPSRVRSAEASVAPAPFRPSINLRAERQKEDIRLTWDRNADMVAKAASGALLIRDGASSRIIPLDTVTLRNGSILYTPSADQVEFELTVSGVTGDQTESLMAIRPGDSTLPLQTASARPAVLGTPQPVARPAAPPSPVVDEANRSIRKEFAAPQRRTGSPAPAPLMEPPPPLTISASGTPPVSQLGASLPKPDPPSSPQLPAVAGPPPARSQFTPALAVGKTMPQLPREARNLLFKAETVSVVAALDASGNIESVKPGSHSLDILMAQALHAARLWKFQPALLNGKPVPSQVVIQFEFKPYWER